MGWRICFDLPSGTIFKSRRICIDIPLLVKRFEIPGPDPCLNVDVIKERFVKDLQVLATIDQLASGLSSGLKKQVQDTVRRSAEAGGLPEGIKLNFGEQKQQ